MSQKTEEYEKYMRRCLQLATLGTYYVAPNPMVGAVLVNDAGVIIGEGWHQQYGGAHAEVNAFHSVSDESALNQATLYVSLEPCSHFGKTPPCADLIIEKGVKRVVIGCLDPNPKVAGNGVSKLEAAGIEVVTGVLEKECRALNKRFICLHENHRPYIVLKWAQTADGVMGVIKTASSDEKVQPRFVISNPLTKQIVHKMRAENMAIMVGANTALLDNPRLLTSHWSGRNPIRILLDRRRRVPSTHNIFSADAQTIVYADNTDWRTILQDLAERNIHSVMVEGGACVLQHIIDLGLWDEMHIEVSPNKLPMHRLGEEYVFAPSITLPITPEQVIETNSLFVLYNE